ncbi:cobalamin biosynthesis protein CobU [Mycolicibacterium chitae]|uniref:Adenosylcobinamide kinase n=1 Tax=Mycolicibacterium chitae TaxID=1792 RepID=A0A448IDZ1_MYCCI|nr:bifunctional adenosylcobinamide kinase/adenosylcobinamide-phosphate guanylyltransferase [Mycolicibacterium chitae]MCV7106058.1 bifunctional adenosylcobinamide kinase/adenosylcobinamide-phosphate guanylyltransferase [Mycolicibacterium chitae]BBZ01753.1 cobalamin biosynthesis protein CobU [Mycolicibacterium chitae]VEG50588.1 cobalamin biosynthesis protein CobU [Mycolicibacterium chitae]
MRILVTGGVRSGKSRHAEGLLGEDADVTYVAPGRRADGSDPDWDARVALHRSRRPAGWSTVETGAVEEALRGARGPVLVDCLGTWLTAILDEGGLWEAATAEIEAVVAVRLEALCAALVEAPRVVLVTNEVGFGVVPEHRSGRLFRDLLGTVNQRVAAVCDEVHLVVAGRVLKL